MKKIISIVLVILMIMSSGTIHIFAGGTATSGTFLAKEVYNKVHGEGFYDTSGAGKLENDDKRGIVTLRANEWLCYDVSDFAAGRYKVILNTGNVNACSMSVSVDDETMISSVTVPVSGGYYNPQKTVLGIVDFSGSQQKLKLTLGIGAMFMVDFSLEKVEDLSIVSVKSNATSEGTVFGCGSDVFTVSMNKNIKPETYAEGDVELRAADETKLLCDVVITGNIITINLREALESGKDYYIYINGLEGTQFEGITTPIKFDFKADDGSNKTGTTSISVDSFRYENGTITASGFVKSSAGLGINKRTVSLYITPKNSESVLATAVKTYKKDDVDGVFELSYQVPDEYDSLEYTVTLCSEYLPESDYVEKNPKFESQIASTLSGIETIADAIEKFESCLAYTTVDESDISLMIHDMNPIYEKMLLQSFDNASDALNYINQIVYSECIIQAEDADMITDILNDEQKASNLKGFHYELWMLISDLKKSEIASLLVPLSFEDALKLADFINVETEKAYVSDKGIVAPAVSFTSDEIITGEMAQIKAELSSSIKNIYGMHIEVDYENNSAEIFASDKTEIESEYLTESENIAEEGKFKIDIKVPQTDDESASVDTFSGNIFDLKLFASGKMSGVHRFTVNGYFLYHPSEIESKDINVKLPFVVEENPVITVNERTSMTIPAQNIIEETPDVGYYDNPSGGGTRGFEKVGNNAIVFRTKEWVVYDISCMPEGKYELTIKHGNPAALSLSAKVDGVVALSSDVGITPGYTTPDVTSMGMMDLDGEQKLLKIENSGNNAAYIWEFTLEKISPISVDAVTSNVAITSGVLSRGADRLSIKFNNNLKSSTVNKENVTISADGTNLDTVISCDGNKIIIDLKESLEYQKAYTLKTLNIEDIYGQVLVEYTQVLTADDDLNTEGTSTLKTEKFEVDENVFALEGVILSSGGIGISGRNIKIYAKYEDGEELLWGSLVSGENGIFKMEHIFTDEASGKYTIKIEYEYCKTPYIDSVYYFDTDASKILAEEFSDLENGDAVLEKLRKNAESLGIDLAAIETELDDISYITNAMANKKYDKAVDVIEEVNKRVVLEKVNQASDKDSILSVLNNSDELEVIGNIQRDRWETLSKEEKESIAEAIYALERIEKPDDLIVAIDKAINELLAGKYMISSPSVNATSASINVGQSAEIKFAFSKAQTDVVGIHLEIEYEESEKNLFESFSDVEIDKDISKMSFTKETENNKLIYDFNVAQLSGAENTIKKINIEDDILTVSFLAETGTTGTYSPQITGYITYHKDELNQSTAYFVDVPFVLTEQPKIDVSAGNSGGGGSGSDGSSFEGGKGKPENAYDIDDALGNTDNVTNVKPYNAFSDIDNVEWAKESINSLAKSGILSGRGDGTFAPNDNVTRAEICKIIVSAFYLTSDSAECEFADVKNDAWYYKYVAVAKECGIITGHSQNIFAPEETITREDMAAMIYRVAVLLGKKVNSGELFADDNEISAYAKDGVYALRGIGVLDGVGNDMFAPKANVTRAMAAKVIYMLMNTR